MFFIKKGNYSSVFYSNSYYSKDIKRAKWPFFYFRYMFYNCNNLSFLPDISNWYTNDVNDMSQLFYGCKSLISLPDISKWNTDKVIDMSYMFFFCDSLESLPDISIWNTKQVQDISHMFGNCSSLLSIPDISKWNTINVKNMKNLFYSCSSLKILPDISLWKTNNLVNMNNMFDKCNLFIFPDITKWNLKKVKNIKEVIPSLKSSYTENTEILVSNKSSLNTISSSFTERDGNEKKDKYNIILYEYDFSRNSEKSYDDYYENFYK